MGIRSVIWGFRVLRHLYGLLERRHSWIVWGFMDSFTLQVLLENNDFTMARQVCVFFLELVHVMFCFLCFWFMFCCSRLFTL